MPNIGEIKRAREIGIWGRSSRKYIWLRCFDCNKEEWSQLRSERPPKQRCRSCSSRNNTFWRIGDKNSSWKGGKVERICLECGSHFKIYLSQARGKFCGPRCNLIYWRKQGIFCQTPNKTEKRLIDLINEKHLPFRYIGNGEVWLGNRNPDFININGKKQVIELFGTYWHPVLDVSQRIEHYKQYGFSTLVIWEDELESPDKLLKKLRKFSNPIWR